MTAIKWRLLALYLMLSAFQPTPPRQPMKQCSDCDTWNRADADRCIYCNAEFPR
jgi:hypothetical protein